MTKADTWMPLYVGSYLANTTHLTTEQHGAYLLLILAAWKRDGRLPADDCQLASICKMTAPSWRKNRAVLLEFFERDGDAFTHDRVTAEREKAQQLSETRRQVGKLGGRPRKQPESNEKPIGSANANLLRSQTETPSPSPISESEHQQIIEPQQSDARAAPRRATRLKPDWQPRADDLVYAVGEGFDETEVERMAADFRDYWTSKSGQAATKLDWPATWRRWVRTCADRRRTTPRANHEPAHANDKLASREANNARAFAGAAAAAGQRWRP